MVRSKVKKKKPRSVFPPQPNPDKHPGDPRLKIKTKPTKGNRKTK